MSEICRLTIPIDPHETSPNQRRSWAVSNRYRKAAWKAARWVWIQAGKPTADKKVIVHYHIKRRRELDDDNAIAGMKPARDALFNNGITPNDGKAWVVTGLVTQERFSGQPEVLVIVETLE
jgi:hypothetical protein